MRLQKVSQYRINLDKFTPNTNITRWCVVSNDMEFSICRIKYDALWHYTFILTFALAILFIFFTLFPYPSSTWHTNLIFGNYLFESRIPFWNMTAFCISHIAFAKWQIRNKCIRVGLTVIQRCGKMYTYR